MLIGAGRPALPLRPALHSVQPRCHACPRLVRSLHAPFHPAQVCIKATAVEKDSQEAKAVRNWKLPTAKKAGDFAAVLKEVGTSCLLF